MSYFELFSLAPGFAIDKNALSARFRQLQSQYHPDNFASEDDRQKAQALHKASEVNDAYQTLLHPERRAQYLLKLAGIDIADEQQTMHDMDFLTTQMTLREELEAISSQDDPEAAIDAFSATLKSAQQQLEEIFVANYQHSQFDVAADSVRKMKFYIRLRQQLRQLEDNLLDL
ncbi:co-chaperone HscB [Celerinatantimonas yamalensis]|uniref:Co-chaperone protein HscB homolog n=1 Tax=Celerinatantimonas yamalensis TaxID=559956 RepID=A0ABW9G6C2_9GAMM